MKKLLFKYTAVCILLLDLSCISILSQGRFPKDIPDIRLNTFTSEHITLSPDNKQMAVASSNSREIRFIDLEKGEVVAELKPFPKASKKKTLFDSETVGSFSYSKDGSMFFVYSENFNLSISLMVFDLSSGALIRTFTAGEQRALQVSANENYVLSQRNDGAIELYDFRSGSKIKSFKSVPEIQNAEHMMISPDEKFLVAFGEEGAIYFLSLFLERLETIQILDHNGEIYSQRISCLQFSQNGKYFFTGNSNGLLIWETTSKKIVRTISLGHVSVGEYLFINTSRLKWGGDRYIAGLSYDDEKFFWVDAEVGELLGITKTFKTEAESRDIKIRNFELTAEGTKAYFTRSDGPDIWEIDIYGNYSPVAGDPKEHNYYYAFTPDGAELYLKSGHGEDIHKWDLERGSYAGIFAKSDFLLYALFVSEDNSKLIIEGLKERTFIFDIDENEFEEISDTRYQTQQFDLKTGAELVPNGLSDFRSNNRFDTGSRGLAGLLQFDASVGESLLYNTHREALVMATLRGSAKDFVVFTKDGRFDGTEKGIKELLRVVENGQYVSIDSYRAQYHTPGLLRQFAFRDELNNDRSISGDKERTEQAEAEILADIGDKAPGLWAITIGVSNYDNPDLNLRFSARDAEAVAATLRVAGSALFGRENTHVLTLTSKSAPDRHPTKQRIEQALRTVQQRAAFDDVVVVYLSGHGINYRGEEDDFYFLASNARTTQYESSETRARQSLSGRELREFLTTIKAGKQVLIMDACASGVFADNLLTGRDLSKAEGSESMRTRSSASTYVLTANISDKKSYESSVYGQGLLTHTLLRGIKGAALREGEFVDIFRLFQYARDQMELVSRDMNLVQVPVIVAPPDSESFDIGRMPDQEAREKVPVREVRPVFRKTNLLQAGAFVDVLDLSDSVDERLYQLSYLQDAPLVFVQTDYPNAYHIAGEYTRTGETYAVKGKIYQGKTAVADLSYQGPAGQLVPYLLKQIEEQLAE